jgi:hypothetical protein
LIRVIFWSLTLGGLLGLGLPASEVRSDLRMSESSERYLGSIFPDVVMRSGNSVLNIYYLAKGTTYEGYHGILFSEGNEVPSGNNLVRFRNFNVRYYGDFERRSFTYEKSGWLPTNPLLIPRSHVKEK